MVTQVTHLHAHILSDIKSAVNESNTHALVFLTVHHGKFPSTNHNREHTNQPSSKLAKEFRLRANSI